MFDYIEMRKDMSGEDFNGVNLPKYLYFSSKHNPMIVHYNKEEQILTVKGSMPYYIQGHNFFFDLDGAYKAIEDISLELGTDMYDAEVKIMEYGVVVCTGFDIDCFIKEHIATRGYDEDIFVGRGKNYVRKNGAYKLKFYSIWANIDNNKYKTDSQVRKILSKGYYERKHEPMRYEIHGNPKKIFNDERTYYVSDVFTAEFEEQCRDVLYDKYVGIRKAASIVIRNVKRLNTNHLILSLLSGFDRRYKEHLFHLIDQMNISQQSKYMAKTALRKKIEQLPCERSHYTIRRLIVEEFERQKQKNQT